MVVNMKAMFPVFGVFKAILAFRSAKSLLWSLLSKANIHHWKSRRLRAKKRTFSLGETKNKLRYHFENIVLTRKTKGE